MKPELETERLRLRRWRSEDRAPFAALNRDPEVVEFLPSALTRAQSDELVDRIEAHFEEKGFGLWAAEVIKTKRFIGFIGMSVPNFEAHFTPAVEIGWRLAREAWGDGYATEGARAALDYAFERLVLDEIVSFTVPANTRSRAVMERIGLQHDAADDFDHPKLEKDDPLCRHVLYRLSADAWRAGR